jgi:hypothetical protein
MAVRNYVFFRNKYESDRNWGVPTEFDMPRSRNEGFKVGRM